MNRVFKLQTALLSEISKYEHSVEQRDETPNWERIHMISSARIGFILAEKRGVDPEIAACACACHDYGRILYGRQSGHAEAGYLPVKDFLRETELFSESEIEQIAVAVRNHSNKGEIGSDMEEIVKDADILDCVQYGIPLQRREQIDRYENIKDIL